VSANSFAAFVIGATLLTACGTPEMNARGISPEDATEIGRLIHASAPSARILSYKREHDGIVDVWTVGDHLYVAERVGQKWKVHEAIYID
jgi:hypothetical protein